MNTIRLLNRNLILQGIRSSSRFQQIQIHRLNQTAASNLQLQRQLKEKNGEENGKIYITESAVNRLKKILNSNESLRVSIDSGGCKGFNYIFKVEQQIDKKDKIFEVDDSRIVIDEESYDFLKESILDYSDELIKSSFKIKDNPQTSEGCSCGISFSPKMF